jgi:hypothetical protein
MKTSAYAHLIITDMCTNVPQTELPEIIQYALQNSLFMTILSPKPKTYYM